MPPKCSAVVGLIIALVQLGAPSPALAGPFSRASTQPSTHEQLFQNSIDDINAVIDKMLTVIRVIYNGTKPYFDIYTIERAAKAHSGKLFYSIHYIINYELTAHPDVLFAHIAHIIHLATTPSKLELHPNPTYRTAASPPTQSQLASTYALAHSLTTQDLIALLVSTRQLLATLAQEQKSEAIRNRNAIARFLIRPNDDKSKRFNNLMKQFTNQLKAQMGEEAAAIFVNSILSENYTALHCEAHLKPVPTTQNVQVL